MSTILVAVALAVALSQSEDETPETAESRGVFVTVGHPNLSAEELELLDGLPRVGSLAELESAITAETAVLVVDQSAIEVVPREFLRAQYGMGREIIAINVHGRDLAEVLSDRSGTWPTLESWADA